MDGKTVVLELGGKERRLSYDLNAVAEIGERLGIRIRLGTLGSDLLQQEIPLRALRTLLWAGLIHAEPELTEEEVGAWVTQDNVQEVMERFFELFGEIGQGMKQAQEEESPGPPVETTEPEKSPVQLPSLD